MNFTETARYCFRNISSDFFKDLIKITTYFCSIEFPLLSAIILIKNSTAAPIELYGDKLANITLIEDDSRNVPDPNRFDDEGLLASDRVNPSKIMYAKICNDVEPLLKYFINHGVKLKFNDHICSEGKLLELNNYGLLRFFNPKNLDLDLFSSETVCNKPEAVSKSFAYLNVLLCFYMQSAFTTVIKFFDDGEFTLFDLHNHDSAIMHRANLTLLATHFNNIKLSCVEINEWDLT